MLPTLKLGTVNVSRLGMGCMNVSHAYGPPATPEAASAVLLRALDLGITMFDTAALYGFGANEELVGRVLGPHRKQFFLASKCGMTGIDGKRVIDGRPATIKRTCEEALRRLRTEVIDLYYLHRWDKTIPIEESVGAMADLIRQGKIKAIGLSEVSAPTLVRAHAEHPIAAVQSEYSLWSRNVEIAVLDTCKQLGVAFVAFSPASLDAKDIRRTMPRFQEPHYSANARLLAGLAEIASQVGATSAQVSLAWVLAKGEHIIALPGTTRLDHLQDNVAACTIRLDAKVIVSLDALINEKTVSGGRYSPAAQADVDTEEFAA
jgi:aryl-alcohol dehydrogenase-like predicted oxidoreductase